jgi:hypothetical protein
MIIIINLFNSKILKFISATVSEDRKISYHFKKRLKVKDKQKKTGPLT